MSWLESFFLTFLTVFVVVSTYFNSVRSEQIEEQLDRIEVLLLCPDSKPQYCDGEFCGCTGDESNWRGTYH